MKKYFWKKIFITAFADKWSMMFRKKGSNEYLSLKQPDDIARADTFAVEYDNKTFLFFEEFQRKQNGYLRVGELNPQTNSLDNITTILQCEYHLSYPNIFMYKGEWYMIPETHQNRTLDLYKFTDFPYGATKVKTLMDNILTVDTSILFKDNMVYLFTTPNQPFNDNLSIYYTSDLLHDEFQPHPSNPIEVNTKYSRLAGSFMEENGRIFRVSQDCDVTYGYTVYKHEVITLTTTEYQEKYCEEMEKPKSAITFHTYSQTDNYEFIDVRLINYNPLKIINRILNKINDKFSH